MLDKDTRTIAARIEVANADGRLKPEMFASFRIVLGEPGANPALIDSLAEPGLWLVGHSMGGRIAFEMWAQAPQRIERLALLDTSYHPLPEGEDGERERAGDRAAAAHPRSARSRQAAHP